jgi:hypothetical protein
MKLARIIHDGSLRNRAVDERDRRAEPRGGATHRLGVPKGVCPLRGDSTRGAGPLVSVDEAGFRVQPARNGRKFETVC